MERASADCDGNFLIFICREQISVCSAYRDLFCPAPRRHFLFKLPVTVVIETTITIDYGATVEEQQ